MIRAFIIVRRARFDAQNKDLAGAQVETFDDFPAAVGRREWSSSRSEGNRRKDVYVAIQVLALDSYQEVARVPSNA